MKRRTYIGSITIFSNNSKESDREGTVGVSAEGILSRLSRDGNKPKLLKKSQS